MALFKPYKCLEAQLGQIPVVDGQVIFTTDTNKVYMDDGAERKEYTPEVPDASKTFIQKEQPETARQGDVWMVVEED